VLEWTEFLTITHRHLHCLRPLQIIPTYVNTYMCVCVCVGGCVCVYGMGVCVLVCVCVYVCIALIDMHVCVCVVEQIKAKQSPKQLNKPHLI